MTRSSSSPVRALRSRLARLRHRIRALFAVQGLARWLTAAVVALFLFFLADWLLDLPIGVRRFIRLGLLDRPEGLATASWIVLLLAAALLTFSSTRRGLGAAPVFAFAFAGIGGVLGWLALRLFRPVGVSLPDEELALSVEQKYRRLNDRLAAALDFEKELEHPSRGESAAMMRVVLDEAAEQAEGLTFARAISTRRTLTWAGGALGAIVAAGLVAALWPATVGLWARRSLLLEERTWPKATALVAVDLLDDSTLQERDPGQPYLVALGRPLVVRARAEGRVPDEVLLVDRVEGARVLPRRMNPAPDTPGLFLIEIRDVRRPFEFVLQGGDDTDQEPLYRVAVTVPPRVLAMSARLTYPAYLAREDEVVQGGNLSVPEGTRVEVSFEADVEIAEARVVLLDEVIEADAQGGDRHGFTFTFDATKTARYRILLSTPAGRASDPAANAYEVRVAPDREPRLQWLHPRMPVETTPDGRVPLLALAADDHAISRLDLEVRLADRSVRTWKLVPFASTPAPGDGDGSRGDDAALPATDGPYNREVVRLYVPLDVATLTAAGGAAPLAPARLAARVIAVDSKGQKQEGTWVPIDVYGSVDLQRMLADRRASVRAELAAVLAEQKSRRSQLAELVGSPLGDAERDLLKSIQFNQAKIAQDTDEAVQSLLEIFNAWVYDRLGAENPNERILSILDRHHRLTYGAAVETGGEAPDASDHPGDPVFPFAVYDEVVQAWRDRTIFDTGLLGRMLVVLAEATDAAARRAPAAHRTAGLVAAGEEPVEQLLEAQDALIASLDRVLDAMRSWQSLNQVILHLRAILEEQEALNERLERSGQKND